MPNGLLMRRRAILAELQSSGGGSGGGAKAFVQKGTINPSSGVTTQTTTLTGVTAGNLLICCVAWDMNAASGAPTIDSTSVTAGWQLADQGGPVVALGNSGWITGASIYYLPNAPSGSNSLKLNMANTCRLNALMFEASGALTSNPLDKVNHNSTTSATTLGATTAATTWATEIAVCAIATRFVSGNSNITLTDPPTGYTSLAVLQDTNTYAAFEFAYQILSSTGTQSATWSWAGAGEAATVMATFK